MTINKKLILLLTNTTSSVKISLQNRKEVIRLLPIIPVILSEGIELFLAGAAAGKKVYDVFTDKNEENK